MFGSRLIRAFLLVCWLILMAVLGIRGRGCGHPGPTHWVDATYAGVRNPRLVCDSTGLKVAEVLEDQPNSWSVWGGNGAGYGSYETEAQAKIHAEELVLGYYGFSFELGSKWLICPEGKR